MGPEVMARVIKALGRIFNLPDNTTDDAVSSFLSERQAEMSVGVDAMTQAAPVVEQPTVAKVDTTSKPLGLDSIAKAPISNDDLRATIMIESSGNPDVENRFGYKGLLQLGDARAKELGVKDPFDPEASINGYMKHAEQAEKALKRSELDVDGFSVYLLWQQGMTGGRDILKDTDKPLAGFKREKNMRNNQPPTKEWRTLKNPTVGDWVEQWRKHFEQKRSASFSPEIEELLS